MYIIVYISCNILYTKHIRYIRTQLPIDNTCTCTCTFTDPYTHTVQYMHV